MNILAFLNSYTEGKSGGDMCFIEIFKRISKKNLTVVTSQLGKNLCKLHGLKAHYEITTSESSFAFVLLIYPLRIAKGIFVAILKGNIDVIYITSDAWPDVLPAVFSKIRNPQAKVVAKVFHLIPETRILSSLTQQISHLLLKIIAHYIIVDNTLLKKELVTSGFISSKIIVNYPAIDSAMLQKIKGKKQYSATFMSRLHPSKGVFELIEIWKIVIKKFPTATLGIIGKGDMKIMNELQLLIKKHKLSKHISLLGFLADEEAYSLIKGSTVFVFPSHEEGFGMAVAETIALGVPIVAYDLPVFHETFGPVILTVPQFEPDLFAKKIITVLDNPKKYDKVVATGKKTISQFTWEIAAEKELEIIHK